MAPLCSAHGYWKEHTHVVSDTVVVSCHQVRGLLCMQLKVFSPSFCVCFSLCFQHSSLCMLIPLTSIVL